MIHLDKVIINWLSSGGFFVVARSAMFTFSVNRQSPATTSSPTSVSGERRPTAFNVFYA